MVLKKIFNGHFRRVPGDEKGGDLFLSERNVQCENDKEISETNMKKGGANYGIVDNVVYGVGLGVGAVGLAVALVSSTVLASTLLFSTYFCVSGCNKTEEEIAEISYR